MLPVLRSSMMTKMATCLFLWSLTSLFGCVEKPDLKNYKKARAALKAESFENSVFLFEKVLRESSDTNIKNDAARGLVEIFSKKSKFEKLDKVLEFLTVEAPESRARKEAKQQLADNNYFNLRNYKKAIQHYSHLMAMGHNLIANHLMVVKSYFNLDELTQSLYEANALLEKENELDDHTRFELLLLKANISFSDKEYKNAAKAFYDVLQKFPEAGKKNFVLLNLAMSYEEEGFYKKAVEALSDLRDDYHTPEFIDSKIKHLQSKMQYMPGARGFVK